MLMPTVVRMACGVGILFCSVNPVEAKPKLSSNMTYRSAGRGKAKSKRPMCSLNNLYLIREATILRMRFAKVIYHGGVEWSLDLHKAVSQVIVPLRKVVPLQG